MGDRDLLASLRNIGVLVPGLEYAGELVDGRKKREMCADLSAPFPVHVAKSHQEACSILWTRHPDRAVELAGTTRMLELVQLCSASSVSIAKVIQAKKPRVSHQSKRILAVGDREYRQLRAQPKMLRRLVTLEPELYAYAREAAAQLGHKNFAKLVRRALWKEVALLVPMAPQFAPRRVGPVGVNRAKRRRSA